MGGCANGRSSGSLQVPELNGWLCVSVFCRVLGCSASSALLFFTTFFFFLNKMASRSLMVLCVYVCERKRLRLREIESVASPQVCLQSSMKEPHRHIDNDCLRNECIIATRLSFCRHATLPPRRSLSNAIVKAARLTHLMHIIGTMVAGRDEVVRE